MSEAGYLTCTFKGYDAFSDTFSGGVTRAASAASSLDKLIAVFRKHDYNAVKAAIPIAGTNSELQKTNSAEALAIGNVLDQADCRGGAEYLPAPMNFTAPMTTLPSNAAPDVAEPELQFSINSVQYPQFNPKLSQWYAMTKDAFEVPSTQSKSYIEWLTNRCVIAVRLNLPGTSLMRAKSGLDTRGSNSSILLSCVNQQGNFSGSTADPPNVLLFLESTREMRIGMGKTLQIIL